MNMGLIHYRADCRCDFCHALPEVWVNYKAGGKCISYSRGDRDQMRWNKSVDFFFLISTESDCDLDLCWDDERRI